MEEFRAMENENDFIDFNELEKLQLAKEEEIKKINLRKIKHLEKSLDEKNKKIEQLELKLSNLQEEFDFNYQLISERDNIIEQYESKVEKIPELLAEKDKYISDLTKTVEELSLALNNQRGKKESAEELYKYKINQVSLNYKEELKILTSKNNDLEKLLKEQKSDNEKKMNTLRSNLEGIVNKLEEDKKKIINENNALFEKLKNLEYKNFELTNELNDCNNKVNNLREENIRLVKNADSLESKLKVYESLENEGKGLTQILNEKIKHLKTENSDLKGLHTRIESLNKINEEQMEKIQVLNTQIFKRDMDLEKRNHTIETLNDKIKELNEKVIEVKESTKQSYQEKLDDLKQKNRDISSELHETLKKSKIQEENLKRTEEELKMTVNSLKVALQEKDQNLAKEKEKSNDLENKVKRLVQSIEISKLKDIKDKPLDSESNDDFSKMVNFFNKGNNVNNDTYEDARLKKASKEKDSIENFKLKEKEYEVNQLKKEIAGLNENIDKLDQQLQDHFRLQENLKNEEEENALLREKIKNISNDRKDLIKFQEEIALMNEEKSKSGKVIERLKKENSKLKQEKEKLLSLCSNLRSQINRLENQNKELESVMGGVEEYGNLNHENYDDYERDNDLDWLNNSNNIRNNAYLNQVSFNDHINLRDEGVVSPTVITNSHINQRQSSATMDGNNTGNTAFFGNSFSDSRPKPKNDKTAEQLEKLKKKKNDLLANKDKEKEDLTSLLTIEKVNVSPIAIKDINAEKRDSRLSGFKGEDREAAIKEAVLTNIKEGDRETSKSPSRADTLKGKLLKRQVKKDSSIKI